MYVRENNNNINPIVHISRYIAFACKSFKLHIFRHVLIKTWINKRDTITYVYTVIRLPSAKVIDIRSYTFIGLIHLF